MSPVTALVPDDQEINAAPYPEWAKPGVRAVSQSALLALPGPDFGPAVSSAGNAARRFGDDFATTFGVEVPEGAAVYGAGPVIRKPSLGSGLGNMTATDAEQAALKARLEAEAAQAGSQAAGAGRSTIKDVYADPTAWQGLEVRGDVRPGETMTQAADRVAADVGRRYPRIVRRNGYGTFPGEKGTFGIQFYIPIKDKEASELAAQIGPQG